VRLPRVALVLAFAVVMLAVVGASDRRGSAVASAAGVPAYDHIFVVVEENHAYNQIIGNPAAPTINQLAQTYGLATNYFGVTHPSEPNYVALVGGNLFGVSSDNYYYTQSVNQPSLAQQLDAAKESWKGYFQSMPYPGYTDVCFPRCNGSPDRDPLYASKHNGFMNFAPVRSNPADLNAMVPDGQLAQDAQAGQLPRFGLIVPDECTDMHGSPPDCVDSGPSGGVGDNQLLATGDAYVASVVSTITNGSQWSAGNSAIVVVWDEGNGTQGCCDGKPGGGQVAAIVITSHGPRGLQDNTPYNHYSLLQTIQMALGLGCLQYTCDTANVTPMVPLFATQ
jgi:Phosphoesterase family